MRVTCEKCGEANDSENLRCWNCDGDVSGTLDSSGSGSKEDWDVEFEGKCVSCTHASPSNRKHQMNCSKSRAISRGLKTNGGGGGSPVNGYPVHRLFGCVYWEKPNA